MAVDFEPGAEPGRVLTATLGDSGDRLRMVIERAGIGLFDRDNAVAEAWDRWPEKAEFTFPISSRPPLNVKAGVVDVAIRQTGVTVGQVADDTERMLGLWSNLISIAPITVVAAVGEGAEVEREAVRRRAIEEGAGAPLGDLPGRFADVFKGTRTLVVTVAIAAAIIGVVVIMRAAK